MDIIIKKYDAAKVPQELHSSLEKLTIHGGSMWPRFTQCQSYDKYPTNNWHAVYGTVHIAFDDDTPVGWSLRWKIERQHYSHANWVLFIFVASKYRRQGIGTMLSDRTSKYLSNKVKVQVIPWDHRSDTFWQLNIEQNKKLVR